MRVLIVDDHAVMRSGMRALLEKTDDVKVWERRPRRPKP